MIIFFLKTQDQDVNTLVMQPISLFDEIKLTMHAPIFKKLTVFVDC